MAIVDSKNVPDGKSKAVRQARKEADEAKMRLQLEIIQRVEATMKRLDSLEEELHKPPKSMFEQIMEARKLQAALDLTPKPETDSLSSTIINKAIDILEKQTDAALHDRRVEEATYRKAAVATIEKLRVLNHKPIGAALADIRRYEEYLVRTFKLR